MATDPTTLPVDTSTPLRPSHILYIKTDNSFKGTSKIIDFTSQLQHLYSPTTDLSDRLLRDASSLAKSTPSQPLYTIKKENLLASKATAKDVEGNKVAEWSSSILSLGKTTFTFADGSHSSHGIELKPVVYGTRTMEFVKDSVLYFWESKWFDSESRGFYKVVSGMKKEVAQYAQTKGRVKGGVLVINEDEIDALVCVLTLCACLEGKDSFSR